MKGRGGLWRVGEGYRRRGKVSEGGARLCMDGNGCEGWGRVVEGDGRL